MYTNKYTGQPVYLVSQPWDVKFYISCPKGLKVFYLNSDTIPDTRKAILKVRARGRLAWWQNLNFQVMQKKNSEPLTQSKFQTE